MNKVIISIMFLIFISGCSSKIGSLNLQNKDFQEKSLFFTDLELGAVEVVFVIDNNQVYLKKIAKSINTYDLRKYSSKTESAGCLEIRYNKSNYKRHYTPCSIYKNDENFYKKTLFGKSLDNENIILLGREIEGILNQNYTKRLSGEELLQFFNSSTIYYLSSDKSDMEKEYHDKDNTTYYKKSNGSIVKGIWKIKGKKICYKYTNDSKEHCHKVYRHENYYYSNSLTKYIRKQTDIQNLKSKYNKILRKKVERERVLEEKRLAKKEKTRQEKLKKEQKQQEKIAKAKQFLGQTVVWNYSRKIQGGLCVGAFFMKFCSDTKYYTFKFKGVVQRVDNSGNCVIKITGIDGLNQLSSKQKSLENLDNAIGKTVTEIPSSLTKVVY